MTHIYKIIAIPCIVILFSSNISCSFGGTPSGKPGPGIPFTTSKKPAAPSTPKTVKSIEDVLKSIGITQKDSDRPGITDVDGNNYTPKEFSMWLFDAKDSYNAMSPSINTYCTNKRTHLKTKFGIRDDQAKRLINGVFLEFITVNHAELNAKNGTLEFDETPNPDNDTGPSPKSPRNQDNPPAETDEKDDKKSKEIKGSSSRVWLGLGIVGTVIAIYAYNSWNKTSGESAPAA